MKKGYQSHEDGRVAGEERREYGGAQGGSGWSDNTMVAALCNAQII